MVAVSVAAEHHVDVLDVLFFFGTGGIAHHPRIDEDGFAAGRLDAEGRMSEPCELDAVKVHRFVVGRRSSAQSESRWAAGNWPLILRDFSVSRRGILLHMWPCQS